MNQRRMRHRVQCDAIPDRDRGSDRSGNCALDKLASRSHDVFPVECALACNGCSDRWDAYPCGTWELRVRSYSVGRSSQALRTFRRICAAESNATVRVFEAAPDPVHFSVANIFGILLQHACGLFPRFFIHAHSLLLWKWWLDATPAGLVRCNERNLSRCYKDAVPPHWLGFTCMYFNTICAPLLAHSELYLLPDPAPAVYRRSSPST